MHTLALPSPPARAPGCLGTLPLPFGPPVGAAALIQIRRITRDDPLYRQECQLREQVLLNSVGLDHGSFCEAYPGYEERFEHFVAVLEHPSGPRVVGCALLLPGEPEAHQGKLMQMAVDPQRQGEGLGRRLVVAIEGRAFGELGLTELYCHSQTTASGFYGKLGWQIDGDEFTEAGVPHYRMSIKAAD